MKQNLFLTTDKLLNGYFFKSGAFSDADILNALKTSNNEVNQVFNGMLDKISEEKRKPI